MRWSEIDLDNAWTLPATRSKNRRAYIVMLASQTVERLVFCARAGRKEDRAEHGYVDTGHNGAAREWTQRWVDHLAALAGDLSEARA